jgi:hypothetical protein
MRKNLHASRRIVQPDRNPPPQRQRDIYRRVNRKPRFFSP